MNPAITFSVADLARDEGLRFRCHCRARTFRRDQLVPLLGADARQKHIGLRPELWCGTCHEPPLESWVVLIDDPRR